MSGRKGGAALSPGPMDHLGRHRWAMSFDTALQNVEDCAERLREENANGNEQAIRVLLSTLHINAEYLYENRP